MDINLIFLELISIFLLIYSAKNENEMIYLCNNENIPSIGIDMNINLIKNSILCLFKRKYGEIIVFNYSILFILLILNTYLYIYLNLKLSFNINIYILISTIIIFLHIAVPYYFTYLKNYESLLKKGMSIEDWFDYSLRTHKYTKEKIIKNLTIDNINEDLISLDNYNYYLLKSSSIEGNGLIPLNKEEFKKFIPFFDKYNFFIKEDNKIKRIFIEKNKIELYNIESNFLPMYFGIFKNIDFNLIFFTRIVESITFFIILNYLIIGG